MKKARKQWGLGAALILAAGTLLAMATPTVASAAPSAPAANPPCTISQSQYKLSPHAGHRRRHRCRRYQHHLSGPAAAARAGIQRHPPLLFHGTPPTSNCFSSPCNEGNVMMTQQTGPLVITPIFWSPPGHPMSLAYKAIITSYLGAVALASGQDTNVFSVLNEYFGNNGKIHYNIRLGFPVNDTHPLPASGCTLESADTSGIYADGSGYNACLDDSQLQAEVNSVSAAFRQPHNLSHIFVLYLPKQVESCFLPGETTSVGPNGQFCTINNEPTAGFCAYHSEDPSNAVYADLAYPIYNSPTGFTCGSDARFPVVESPNHNPDADTEVSPTSHEVSEAITDPDDESGWYDSTGNEIGDDCAYIYGATNGQAGGLYNQTIFGLHFLTQQEFSNRVFSASGGTAGCVDSQRAEF